MEDDRKERFGKIFFTFQQGDIYNIYLDKLSHSM